MAGKKGLLGPNIAEIPDEDFVPYACYFDKQTILTKNGDLLKVIKIPNYIENSVTIDLFELRDKIREALQENSNNPNISFWFNTVRKPYNLKENPVFDNALSAEINEKWNTENNWEHQFVNEVYITVVSSEEEKSIFNPLRFLTTLFMTGIYNSNLQKLNRLNKSLNIVVKSIVEKLSDFGCQILTIKKDEAGFCYSEHETFFSLLINGVEQKNPLQLNNLSEDLIKSAVAYGFNTIELVTSKTTKKFTSVLSLKMSLNLTLSEVDKLIQLQMPFIITQMTGYVDKVDVEEKFKDQKEVLLVSEDSDLAYISGMEALVSVDANKKTSYSWTQTTIMVNGDTQEELEKNIETISKTLNNIGLAIVREDIFMPTLFWSQLPANFSFLKRFSYIPSEIMAVFASLYNFPIGKIKGNYWNNYITILKTALKTPYFFNFHYNENGNTFIVGPEGSGRTTTLNFFISEATKVCKKIFYIDCNRSSEVFINALNGKYYRILKDTTSPEALVLNPLSLPNNEENINFLSNWIKSLVSYQDMFVPLGETETPLQTLCNKIPEKLKASIGNLKTLTDVLNLFNTEETKLIYNKLLTWTKSGNLGFLFDNENEIDFTQNIIGVDIGPIMKNEAILAPFANYIFQKLFTLADGQPCILAIDNAWKLFDNKLFGPNFMDLMVKFISNDISVILTTEGSESIGESNIQETVNDAFGSEIYLTNKQPTVYQKKIFNISDEETKILSFMKLEDKNFLLKNNSNIVIGSLKLDYLEEKLLILSDTTVSINAMKKAKEITNSEDSAVWIPVFCDIIKQYEKQVKEKKLKEQEIRQLKWEESHSSTNTTKKIVASN